MSNQIVKIDASAAVALPIEQAGKYIEASRAANTWKAYSASWQAFASWCADKDVSDLPASPETVLAYVSERAEAGRKVATLNLDLTAIKARHAAAGHSLDTGSAAFKAIWQGIRRSHVTEQKQVAAFTLEDLARYMAMPSECILAQRDRALLALGLLGALRRSELVSLDLGKVGGGNGSLVITERGVVVTLVTSKSSQEEAVEIVIPRAVAPDSIAAIEAWIDTAGIEPGSPLFRGVNNAGVVSADRLSDMGVVRAVKRAALQMALAKGLSAEKAAELACTFGGHSLRAGAITSMAMAGVTDSRIMKHSRHKSAEMIARYTRAADAWTNSPLRGLGV